MVLREKKPEEPSRKSCMQDYRDGDHKFNKWQNKQQTTHKSKIGFESESAAEYTGIVIEQWRVCRTCNLTEMRISA